MGAVAEFERALILERQREGIALAKERGAYKGRAKRLLRIFWLKQRNCWLLVTAPLQLQRIWACPAHRCTDGLRRRESRF